MKKWLALFFVALLILLVYLFSLIPSEDPSIDAEQTQTSPTKQTSKKYYSLTEIAQMKANDPKVSPEANSGKTLSEGEILTILQTDDICELKGKLDPIRNNIRSGLGPFFRLRSPISEELEDTQLIGPVFKGPFRGDHNFDDILPAVKFFNALLFAGMLSGIDAKEIDYTESLQLLERLENSDSTNAAYPLFRAAVLHKMNAPTEEVRIALAQAFSRPKFDTFERRISEAIYRQSFASVMAFFYAEALLHSMPVVDWGSVLPILKEHLGKDTELDRSAIAFGRRLRTQGERANGEFEFILWSAVEYEYANIFEKYAWENAFPGIPQPKFKRNREIRKPHQDLLDLENKMEGILHKGAPCDPKVFQDIYNWNRKAFEKSLSKLKQ